MPQLEIAVQLYTVRDLTAKDFAGTVRDVARIGYRNVELAGYGNLKSAKEVRKMLDDNGLRVIGAHAKIEDLEQDANRVMDENEALGNGNIVVPWLAEDRRREAEGWKRVADGLNRIGQAVRGRGFQLAYHNHSFEFARFDDGGTAKAGLDILWENTDRDLVKAELDVYWVKHGGVEPADYVHQLGGRIALVHLKDMAAGEDRRFAPVGGGILDFRAILDAVERIDGPRRWGIVEQDDTYDTPPLEAIGASLRNLRALGAA